MKIKTLISLTILIFVSFAFIDVTENQVIIGTGDICGLEGDPDYSLVVHSGKAYKDDGSMWTTPADTEPLEKVKPLEEGLAFIEQFQPIKGIYKKSTPKAGQEFVGFDGAVFARYFPDQVFEVPMKGEEDKTLLVANPSVLPYVTINAVKELNQKTKQLEKSQKTVKNLEERLERLEAKFDLLLNEKNARANNSLQTSQLSQNYPNPTTGTTVIPYKIKGDQTAKILITDVQGRLLVTHDLNNESGELRLDLSKMGFQQGTYYYNLVVNEQVIAAKSMILVK